MSSEPQEDVKPKLTIRIMFEGETIAIKAKSTTQFSKIFEAVEKKYNRQQGAFRFSFEGQRIMATQTPLEIGMEDEDVIDANLEQTGGDR